MSGKNINAGHRQRLRDRFAASGLDDFAEHNILELLLCYAIPRKDVNRTAHLLIHQFGSLAGVLDASAEELIKVEGVGENTATFLKLIPAVGRQYQLSRMSGKQEYTHIDQVGKYLVAKFHGLNREEALLLCFDQRGRMVVTERLAEGVSDAVSFNARRVAEIALSRNSNSIILAHNHLNGSTTPSRRDWETTRILRKTMTTLNVTLLDHIIVADDKYFSMAGQPNF